MFSQGIKKIIGQNWVNKYRFFTSKFIEKRFYVNLFILTLVVTKGHTYLNLQLKASCLIKYVQPFVTIRV